MAFVLRETMTPYSPTQRLLRRAGLDLRISAQAAIGPWSALMSRSSNSSWVACSSATSSATLRRLRSMASAWRWASVYSRWANGVSDTRERILASSAASAMTASWSSMIASSSRARFRR